MSRDLPECAGSNEDEALKRSPVGSAAPDDQRDLAYRLLSQGRVPEAADVLRRALELATKVLGRAALSVELGWAVYFLGANSDALRLATGALDSLAAEPETSELLVIRGGLSLLVAYTTWLTDPTGAKTMAKSAEASLDRALATGLSRDGRAAAFYELGRAQQLLGQQEKAAMSLRCSVEVASDNFLKVNALTALSLALRTSNRLKEAEQATREGLRLAEMTKIPKGHLLYELGTIYRATGRRDEAVDAFREALARTQAGLEGTVSPGDLPRLQWDLAELRYEAKEYAAAAEVFQDILRHEAPDDPRRCTTLAWLGNCFAGVGARLQAKQCYEEVLASPHADQSLRASVQESLAALAETPGGLR